MMRDTPPYQWTAVDIANAVQSRDISVQQVVSAHIERIQATHHRLNAVIWPRFDEAMTEAKQADEMIAKGHPPGPLFGVPITIKDQYFVKGTPTSLGLDHRCDERLHIEGSLVKRLREQGAIILGKTNVPQLMILYETHHARYGHTLNPWNPERTPGGSSGGEAAIIAACGSPLGLGGDMGGSGRIPAHCSGIHALKPTAHRFPNDDSPLAAGFMGDFAGFEGFVSQPAPMARSVADLKLMMDVLLSSPLASLDMAPPVPWRPGPIDKPKKFNVGVFTDNGYFPASPSIRRCVTDAANTLSDRGFHVTEFHPPSPREAIDLTYSLLGADGGAWIRQALAGEQPIPDIARVLKSTGISRWLRRALVSLLLLLGQPRQASMLRSFAPCDAARYWGLLAARSRYRDRFLEAMNNHQIDILLCPAYGLPAPPLNSNTTGVVTLAGSYAILFNLLGMPAGVASIGKVRPDDAPYRAHGKDAVESAAQAIDADSAGLPIGVQVVGRHWREDTVLTMMRELESCFETRKDYP